MNIKVILISKLILITLSSIRCMLSFWAKVNDVFFFIGYSLIGDFDLDIFFYVNEF